MKFISLTLTLFCLAHASNAKIRKYFVGVVEVLWDYAPRGLNQKTSKLLNEDS